MKISLKNENVGGNKMAKRLEEITKKHFVVALPKELPIDTNVPGYDGIKKIGGTSAGSPQSAVSHYLHRVFPDKAKLIVDILNERLGGANNYVFEVPRVEAEEGKLNFQEKIEMTEYALAYDSADFYHLSSFAYLKKAKDVLKEFRRLRPRQE